MYEQLQILASWLAKAAELWAGFAAFLMVAGAGMVAGMALQARQARRKTVVYRQTWQTSRPWWDAGGAEVTTPGGDQLVISVDVPDPGRLDQSPPRILGGCVADGWRVEVTEL